MDVCHSSAGVLFALIRLSQQRNPMFNVREREFSFARQGEQQHWSNCEENRRSTTNN
jgi:hypothetical protein